MGISSREFIYIFAFRSQTFCLYVENYEGTNMKISIANIKMKEKITTKQSSHTHTRKQIIKIHIKKKKYEKFMFVFFFRVYKIKLLNSISFKC